MSKKEITDRILHEAVMLFANCDNTKEARKAAKEKEREILYQLKDVDPELFKIVLPDETDSEETEWLLWCWHLH